EDPGHQVLLVVHPRDLDGPAEHVREQQHEHDGLDRREDQQIGDPLDLDQIALRHDPAVVQRRGDQGHCSSSVPTDSPVNFRNTSSSVARWMPRSTGSIPATSSCRTTSMSAPAPPLTGPLTRRASTSTVGGSPQTFSTIVRTVSTSAAVATPTSNRSPPTWRLRSAGVPRAIARPWSITTTSSASRSASSRYCVVSSSVAPDRTRSLITSHMPSRPRGSSPVVGSSRKMIGGEVISAPARSSRRRMPPEYVLTGRLAASSSENRSNNSRARSRAFFFPNW